MLALFYGVIALTYSHKNGNMIVVLYSIRYMLVISSIRCLSMNGVVPYGCTLNSQKRLKKKALQSLLQNSAW